MSTRPSLPKPLPRWPFYLGDAAFLLLALITLASADSPPGLGHIVLATICVVVGIGLLIVPYLIEYDAKVRFAESQAKDMAETQMRRFGQMTEQLSNVVSRSQSIEEQVGQALGTLEEIAEKLGTQADDLTQLLTKSGGPGKGMEEMKSALDECGDGLKSIEKQVSTLASSLSKARAAGREASASTTGTLAEITAKLEAIAGRLDSLERNPGTSSAAPTVKEPPASHEAAPPPPAPVEDSNPGEETTSLSKADSPPEKTVTPASADEPTGETEKQQDAEIELPKPTAGTTKSKAKTKPKPKRKSVPKKAVSESLELPLDGTSDSARSRRREAGPATSLVATAYIGIGNKLYIRGEGPGLSWDEGVPMQFLAIGKWGWTSTEVDGQVVCRIYRNDETPMLDEDIIIPAGSKVEVTPRF